MNATGYNVSRSGNDFEFFTALGAAYAVSFVPAGEYLENNHPLKDFIFRIDIEQNDPGPYNYPDFRIGITIAEIVYYFPEIDNRNVIFYICDPRDDRVKARQRKFAYWQRIFDDGNSGKIIAAIIEKAKDNLSNK